jgi:hypothetical protein
VLDVHRVRLERADGSVTCERASGKRSPRRWDALDLSYFLGYGLWTYFALPALLLREDIAWREIEDGVLEADFPVSVPSHCPRQRFEFDRATGLLVRNDYTAEIAGSWARAAHVVLEHRDAGGLPYASRRRVTARRSNGVAMKFPTMVEIEIANWRLT